MPGTGKRSNPVHDTPPKAAEKRAKETRYFNDDRI